MDVAELSVTAELLQRSESLHDEAQQDRRQAAADAAAGGDGGAAVQPLSKVRRAAA